MASDRIFGLVTLITAVAYIAAATQIQTNFFSGQYLPKLFPILIGTVAAIASLVMILKPDPEPEWPASNAWINMAIAVVVLALYSVLLKPLGFILPTAFAAGIISYQIFPRKLPPVFRCGLVARIIRLVQVPLGPWQYRSIPHPNPRKTVGSNFNSHSICGALTWIFLPILRLVLALHCHLTR